MEGLPSLNYAVMARQVLRTNHITAERKALSSIISLSCDASVIPSEKQRTRVNEFQRNHMVPASCRHIMAAAPVKYAGSVPCHERSRTTRCANRANPRRRVDNEAWTRQIHSNRTPPDKTLVPIDRTSGRAITR